MLVGCILCFISVLLFGLDGQDIGVQYFVLMCNVCSVHSSPMFSKF